MSSVLTCPYCGSKEVHSFGKREQDNYKCHACNRFIVGEKLIIMRDYGYNR
ncbi:MAG: hypothetical protein LBC39_02670 [Methanobrevibacter sp.]|jgi:transposase-like protein|nr:hypothetical protein [Candidatus Methanovirga aequatorialis]